MSDMTQQMAKHIYESIREILDEREMTYDAEQEEDTGDYVVIFSYRGEDMNHRMVLRVMGRRGLLTIAEALYFEVNPANVSKLIEACNHINAVLLLGTFYFDGDDSIRFYNPLLFNGSSISKETIDELMLRTVSIVEDYDDKLAAVNKGYLDPEKVVGDD